jgi:hypothetical protein
MFARLNWKLEITVRKGEAVHLLVLCCFYSVEEIDSKVAEKSRSGEQS